MIQMTPPPKKQSSRESRPSAKVVQAAAQEAELVNACAEKQAAKEKQNRKQCRNQINDNSEALSQSDSTDKDGNDDPITQRGSHLRGELKTKARLLVEASFGFETGEHCKIIKKNHERAEFLKEDHCFLYKYPSEELENCKELYQNPLIQKIVNAMWFQNKHNEGIKFMDIFNPFPILTLALVLSVIDCCLDEWMTGIKTDAPFKAKFYSDIYEGHLKNFRMFDEQSQKSRSGLCNAILVKLHNRGRFNAGAQPASTLNFPSLSHCVFELAIKEYLNDPLTDTDGENGPLDDDD
ncbi:hypothetical protein H0H92_005806 [Tricholoma furcatifolium]|nr:hypothetical protein H0H92_005806 [Tricholoma furcatifolium]